MTEIDKLLETNVNYLEKGRIVAEAISNGETQTSLAVYTGVDQRVFSRYYNIYKDMQQLKKDNTYLYNMLVKNIEENKIKDNLMMDVLSRIDELGFDIINKMDPNELNKNIVNSLMKTKGLGQRQCTICRETKDLYYFRPKRQKCKKCERIKAGTRKSHKERNLNENIITEIKKTIDVVQDRNEKEIESGLETIEYTLAEVNATLDNMDKVPNELITKIEEIYNQISLVKEKAYEINN